MNKATVLKLLNEYAAQARQRFDARRLALFGSAARDALRDDSDIDVLVDFERPATFSGYMGLKFYLEGNFGRSVDLVTENGLRRELRPNSRRRPSVSRDWRLYVSDMRRFCGRILSYSKGLPREIRSRAPQIEWQSIIALLEKELTVLEWTPI